MLLSLGAPLTSSGVSQREKEEVLVAFAAHKSEVTEGSGAMARSRWLVGPVSLLPVTHRATRVLQRLLIFEPRRNQPGRLSRARNWCRLLLE